MATKKLTGRNWDEVQAMLNDPKSYIVIFVSTHGSIPQPGEAQLSFTVPENTFVLSSSKFGMTSNTSHANEFFKMLQPNGIQRSFDFFFGRYGKRGEIAFSKQDKTAFDLLQCAFPGEQAVNKVLSYGIGERMAAEKEEAGWGMYILDPALPQPAYTAKNVGGKNNFFEMNETLVRKKFMINGKEKPIVNLFKRYTNAEEVTNIMRENYPDRIKLIFFESCAVVYDDIEDHGYNVKHYASAQQLWNANTYGGVDPAVFKDKPVIPSFIISGSMNLEPFESNDNKRLTALLNNEKQFPKREKIDFDEDVYQQAVRVRTRSEIQTEIEKLKVEYVKAKYNNKKITLENMLRADQDHVLTRSEITKIKEELQGKAGGKRTRRKKLKRRKSTRRK